MSLRRRKRLRAGDPDDSGCSVRCEIASPSLLAAWRRASSRLFRRTRIVSQCRLPAMVSVTLAVAIHVKTLERGARRRMQRFVAISEIKERIRSRGSPVSGSRSVTAQLRQSVMSARSLPSSDAMNWSGAERSSTVGGSSIRRVPGRQTMEKGLRSFRPTRSNSYRIRGRNRDS